MNLAPAYDAWLEEVESKAIAKGKIEGKTEGKTEEQVTIARRMLSKNLPLTDISDFTGLSIEFLQTLPNESSN